MMTPPSRNNWSQKNITQSLELLRDNMAEKIGAKIKISHVADI